MEIKKIKWYKRLFMNWDSLKNYFGNYYLKKENEFTIEKTKFEAEIKNLNEKLFLNTQNFNLRINEIKHQNKNLLNSEQNFKTLHNEIKNNFNSEKMRSKNIENQKNELWNHYEISKTRIKTLEDQISNIRIEKDNILNKISQNLLPLQKIDRSFFQKATSKGKGELGEMQLEIMFEKSGINKDIWEKNLNVNGSIVEFAIREKEKNKWIPIDSKVIEAEFDEITKKNIVDEAYIKRVLEQAKKISKLYLNKRNTTKYGILVLQNEEIFIQIAHNFSNALQRAIEDYKIYILSPSSFIQYAMSLSNILSIYEKVHKEQKLFDDVLKLVSNINKFQNAIVKTHKNFNIAIQKHFITIQNQYNNVSQKIGVKAKMIDDKNIIANNENESLIIEK